MANRPASEVMVVMLRKLGFKDRGHDALDHANDFSNDEMDITIFDDGDWVLMWEEVRKRGSGLSSLLSTIKKFKKKSSVKEAIRGMIEQEIEEMTATGDAAGFGTPNAFQGDDEDNKKKRRNTAASTTGFEIVKGIKEAGDPYYAWRNDESMSPRQKIGRAISEINKQLTEMNKVVRRSSRLKTEMGVSNSDLWKRTNESLLKIEQRMTGIAQQIRSMRG